MHDTGLLTGLTRAWFQCYTSGLENKKYSLDSRPQGRWGISVHDDRYALEYQISDYRAYRAKIALTGLTCLSSWSMGITKSNEEAKENGRQITIYLLKNKRKRAVWAKRKLKGLDKGHILYKDGDPNVPDSIKDRNGQVVLDLCKVCGKGESELTEGCEKWQQ